MSWPVAYRGGQSAVRALAMSRAGFQSFAPAFESAFMDMMAAGLSRGALWAARSVLAGELLIPLLAAVVAIEVYRLWRGGNVAAGGWTRECSNALMPGGAWFGHPNALSIYGCGETRFFDDTKWAQITANPLVRGSGGWYSHYGSHVANDCGAGCGAIRTRERWYRKDVLPADATTAPSPVPYLPPQYGDIAWGGAVPVPGQGVPSARPPVPEHLDGTVGGQPAWVAPGATVGLNPTINITGTRTYTGWVSGVRAVPATGTIEQKLKTSPMVTAMIGGFNAGTELCDAIGAIFKGLPKSYQAAAGGTKASCADKQAAIVADFRSVDWGTAIKEMIWNDIEDRFWAMLGLPTKEAGLAYGANAPINTAIGKLTGDQMKQGLKLWREKFDDGLDTIAKWGQEGRQAGLDDLLEVFGRR